MSVPVEMVSDSLSLGLSKIFRVGGLTLTFLYVGALLILVGALLPREGFSLLLAILGFLMIVAVGILFYVKEIRPVMRAQRLTKEKKKIIDAVQSAAIELTDLAKGLQALAFKNAEMVGSVVAQLEAIRPLVRLVPKLGGIVDSEPVKRTEELSRLIVETTRDAEQVIDDLRKALITSDPRLLTPYVKELRSLTKGIDDLLIGARRA